LCQIEDIWSDKLKLKIILILMNLNLNLLSFLVFDTDINTNDGSKC